MRSEIANVLNIYHKNAELTSAITRINEEIEDNYQLIIHNFFPYLLDTYKDWRPHLGEVAMVINLESNTCFEVIIRRVDGYNVKAQAGETSSYYNFELNPKLEEYEMAIFVIPKQNYDDDIKPHLKLRDLNY
jgi:hypothetical protein